MSTKYPLEPLLYIRITRENVAEENLTKARHHLQEMIEKVKKKEKELEDYTKWRVEEEGRLYKELFKKKVKKIDLDEVKVKVSNLRNKELDYVQARDNAIDEREAAKANLENAKILYHQAIFNRKKIDEHKNIWTDEWNKEQERLADLEMEEFTGSKTDYELD